MEESKLEIAYKEDRKELYEFYFKLIAGTGFVIAILSINFVQNFPYLLIMGSPAFFLAFSTHHTLYQQYIFSRDQYFCVYPEKEKIFKGYKKKDSLNNGAVYIMIFLASLFTLMYLFFDYYNNCQKKELTRIKNLENIELLTKYSKKYDSLGNLTSEQLEDLNKLVFSIVQLRTEEISTKE
ncbi:hypothetical protein [Fusobacterium varium]